MFLFFGIVVTMVGHLSKPCSYECDNSWMSDSCAFCKENLTEEDRLAYEEKKKICRIVGFTFLGMGALLLIVSIFYRCWENKNENVTYGVLKRPATGRVGSATQGTNSTFTASINPYVV